MLTTMSAFPILSTSFSGKDDQNARSKSSFREKTVLSSHLLPIPHLLRSICDFPLLI